MIGRALDREVERDLQTVRLRRLDQPGEILERSQLGMDGVVPAFRRADRIGAARIVGRRRQRVVLALAVGPADRMDGRKIENVEAHLLDVGEPGDHVVERAVPLGIAGLRARHQLVPRREGGGRAVDPDGHLAGVARQVGAVPGGLQQSDGVGRLHQLVLAVGIPLGGKLLELLLELLQGFLVRTRAAAGTLRRLHHLPCLGQLEVDRLAGVALLLRLVPPCRIDVAPGDDREAVGTRLLEDNFRRPAVIGDEGERRLGPLLRVCRPMDDRARDLLVAVAEHVGRDDQWLALDALDSETATVDLGRHALDRDTVGRERQKLLFASFGASLAPFALRLDGVVHENPSHLIARRSLPLITAGRRRRARRPSIEGTTVPSPAQGLKPTARRGSHCRQKNRARRRYPS
jgi:hypothetical protein